METSTGPVGPCAPQGAWVSKGSTTVPVPKKHEMCHKGAVQLRAANCTPLSQGAGEGQQGLGRVP